MKIASCNPVYGLIDIREKAWFKESRDSIREVECPERVRSEWFDAGPKGDRYLRDLAVCQGLAKLGSRPKSRISGVSWDETGVATISYSEDE
jgi:hypothetical protein